MRNTLRWLAKTGVVLTAVVLMGMMGVAQAQTSSVATLVATVQSSNGELEVQRAGTGDAGGLGARAPLYVGDVANTGSDSKAAFRFSEGTLLQLNSNTVLELIRPRPVSGGRRSLFRLIRGDIVVRTRALLAVETISGTVAVRGTVFRVTVDAQGITTVTTLEGVVDFFNAFGSVTVRAGEESTARLNTAPTRPIPMPGAAYDIMWTRDLDRAEALDTDNGNARGRLTNVAPRRSSFWKQLLPALAVGVVVGLGIHNSSGSSNEPTGSPQTGGE